MIVMNKHQSHSPPKSESARPQPRNGKRGADPPNGKAPCYGRSSKTWSADGAYSGSEEKQAQSCNGFQEPATGSIIGVVGKPYDRLPAAIFEPGLSPAALGILCYLLSRPPGWDISAKQLRQHFGGHTHQIGEAFKELRHAGWTNLAQLRTMDGRHAGGRMWFARRSLDEPWPKTFMTRDLRSLKTHFLIFRKWGDSINNDIQTKTDQVIQSLGRKENTKSKVHARAHDAFSLTGLKGKKAEIIQRFNKTFVLKGAQPVTKVTPRLRRVLQRCLRADYEAFEQAALADHKNWPVRVKCKRPGLVALWHTYKPFGKSKRFAFGDMNIAELDVAAAKTCERINELYRENPKGSEKQRAALKKEKDAYDKERARRINVHAKRTGKAKTSVEALRAQRAARRSEREHEAITDEPIIPDWMLNANGSGETELVKRE